MNKTVTIPIPAPTPHMYRGFLNRNVTEESFPMSIRWTDADRDYITAQASKLGISFSEFVRWCAYYSAKELTNAALVHEYRKHKRHVDKSGYEDTTQ